MLSALIFVPLAGAALLFLMPRSLEARARGFAALVATATLLIALYMYATFERTDPALQFIERVAWISTLR